MKIFIAILALLAIATYNHVAAQSMESEIDEADTSTSLEDVDSDLGISTDPNTIIVRDNRSNGDFFNRLVERLRLQQHKKGKKEQKKQKGRQFPRYKSHRRINRRHG